MVLYKTLSMLSPYAAVSRNAHEISGNFEMAIRAARSLEAGMGSDQALAHFPAARLAEAFIRTPSAGSEALGGADELESVFRSAQMHRAPSTR